MFWWLVKLCFPKAEWGKVAFSFGDTIYYHKQDIAKDLLAHERVHLNQHHYSKLFACYVFVRYVFSKKYRLSMEIPAYQAQWNVLKNGEYSLLHRSEMAKNLSHPMYGSIISYEEALKLFI